MRYFEIANPSVEYIITDTDAGDAAHKQAVLPNGADDKPFVPRVHDQRQQAKSEAKPTY
jgi:hypothetical protein